MTEFNRRHVLAALGAGLMTPGRVFAEPSSQDIAQRLVQAQQDGKVDGLHSLVVSQRERLVIEHYGRGVDEAWGRPLGTVTFGPSVLHDLRSVSKSVVALVYGIALAADKVPPPEAKLYDQFPEYPDLGKQPGRDRLTIHHVLSMTLGLEWDELTIPYGDLRNSENAMEAAPDRFRFILERSIIGEPGVKWTYCGGATAILGRLIAKGTGQALHEYARRVLFDPIGFGPSEWSVGADGEPRAASGLRLLPRDMLKIGQIALAGGMWNGKEVVPAEWVNRAITPVVAIDRDRSYGYHWYMGDLPASTPPVPFHWVGGIGWGGQRLFAFPALDLVVAMNCQLPQTRPRAESCRPCLAYRGSPAELRLNRGPARHRPRPRTRSHRSTPRRSARTGLTALACRQTTQRCVRIGIAADRVRVATASGSFVPACLDRRRDEMGGRLIKTPQLRRR